MLAKSVRRALATVFAAVLALACLAPTAAYAADASLGVDVGSGVAATATFEVNQKGIREQALELVRYWRQDALDDTNVKLYTDNGELVTMREYLEREGISQQEYLNPSWSNTLERIAIQRAAEADILFSHTRPNGESCWTATADDGRSMGEILASSGDLEFSMEMWAAEKDLYIESPFNAGAGHYGALISPSNTCYGFASVGGMCAGEIAPYQVGSTNATNMDGAYEITVGLPSSAVSADALTPSATSVGVGKSVDVAATLSYSGISFTLDATLTTEDPSIAKVSGCTVTGVKAGSTTLTMTAGGATKSFTFTVGAVQMHRLYNQWTGEHFYTASTNERDSLVSVGWTSEGVGWVAPESSSTPVYRLYNPYVTGGDHHYTTNASERDALIEAGWSYEGVGWYSDDAEGVPLYRQYNPYAKTGTHNYTADKNENDTLVKLGWRAEGIGWYGVK